MSWALSNSSTSSCPTLSLIFPYVCISHMLNAFPYPGHGQLCSDTELALVQCGWLFVLDCLPTFSWPFSSPKGLQFESWALSFLLPGGTAGLRWGSEKSLLEHLGSARFWSLGICSSTVFVPLNYWEYPPLGWCRFQALSGISKESHCSLSPLLPIFSPADFPTGSQLRVGTRDPYLVYFLPDVGILENSLGEGELHRAILYSRTVCFSTWLPILNVYLIWFCSFLWWKQFFVLTYYFFYFCGEGKSMMQF